MTDAGFATTRWSLVLAAGAGGQKESRDALASLCEIYWYPVYTYVRRRGLSPEDAQDLSQEFFARLIERPDLHRPDPDRGRFRSYLLGSVKHFLSNQRQKAAAKKRGGDQVFVSLQREDAERRFSLQVDAGGDPDREYERTWALTLLERVMASLCEEFGKRNQADLYERLKSVLTDRDSSPPYREIARESGLTEGAIKVAVHRMRKRFGSLLRSEIAETLVDSDSAAVEEEVRDLFRALQRD